MQATHNNGTQLSFYTMLEYESGKHNLTGNASGWSIKYYKVCIVKFVTCEPITEPGYSIICFLNVQAGTHLLNVQAGTHLDQMGKLIKYNIFVNSVRKNCFQWQIFRGLI